MARDIALMALAALGLTEAPVHEPVHDHHSEHLMSTTESYHAPCNIRRYARCGPSTCASLWPPVMNFLFFVMTTLCWSSFLRMPAGGAWSGDEAELVSRVGGEPMPGRRGFLGAPPSVGRLLRVLRGPPPGQRLTSWGLGLQR